VLLFARHGAKVVAADIDRAAADETVAQAKAQGGVAIACTCNVADAAAVDAMVNTAIDAFGRLDIIYNNAGITIVPKPDGSGRRLVDAAPADIARLYGVNVDGVINGCQAAIRQFEAQGGPGVIVNTASVAGLTGYGSVVYGSTKGAVVALTRTLAMELAPQGIRVNAVCPAGMPTNFIPGMASDKGRMSLSSQHPLGRPIEPIDCANAALFLASQLASNITGVNLPIDGGVSAGVPATR
jgi:NAD(P)-dependent dehydrogenase (short-subunit alcohol dehydrogenase family)